ALMLRAIAGADPRDATCLTAPVPDYAAALAQGVRGLRLGLPDEYFIEGMDAEVERAVRAAVDVLRGLGAAVERISLPATPHALATYYVIAPAEASSNLARYDGVKYGLRVAGAKDLVEMSSRTRAVGFGAEVKRRIMLGTYVLSAGYYEAYYGRAQKVRTLVRRDFDAAFGRVDLIVAPMTPNVAFKHGEKEDPLSMYLNDVFAVPADMTGLPAISVPCGFSAEGLPIGLQVHAQPLTRSKMFCGCPTTFGAPPNSQTCPVCQGMPGVLPVVNRRAVELGIRAALAFECRVNAACRFARKHYYYPDMPK